MLDPASSKALRAFRADLKAIDPAFPKMVTKVNKAVAQIATEAAGAKARSGTPMQRRAAPAIKAKATQAVAAVVIKTAVVPMANVAFWGSKKRTGWYAHINSPNGRPQGPPWVGSNWSAGVKGEGPYVLNEAIAEVTPRVVETWGQGIDEVTRRAFPGK